MPGSVDGIDPLDAPGELRSPKPSTVSSTAMPIRSSGTSTAGTSACSSSRVRSTTVTSGASNATFSPGCTCRLATMPASGRHRDGILAARCGRAAPAPRRLHVALRDAVARFGVVERVLRDEVLLQQLACSSPASCRPCASCAFAAFERAVALDRAWPRGRRYRCARAAGPAWTDSPSRTVIWRTSPGTLALTVAWSQRLHRPGHRQPARQRLRTRRARGRPARTRARRRPPCLAPPSASAFLASRSATVPPTAPTITNATASADEAPPRQPLLP